MKKFLLAIAVLGATAFTSCSAKDVYTQDKTVLPEAAVSVIDNYFADNGISNIKVDKEAVGGDEYKVVLANGTVIEFNADGSIDEIKVPNTAIIPSELIPAPIQTYVNDNYPNQNIVKYDAGKHDNEVTLSNGVELKFDKQGNFLRIDD